MIPSSAEVVRALWGAARLMRFDPSGLLFFDASPRGFWRSFFAAALVAPLYLIMLAVRDDPWPDVPAMRFAAVETVTYVLSWLVFPVVMLHLADLLDRRTNYVRYIVAYNWCSVWQNAIYVVAALPAVVGLASPEAGGLMTFAALVAIMAYGWFVARAGLEISPFAAFGIVALDLVTGIAMSALTQVMLEG